MALGCSQGISAPVRWAVLQDSFRSARHAPRCRPPLGSSGGRCRGQLDARPAGLDAVAVGVRTPDPGEAQAFLIVLDQFDELVVGEAQARGLADVLEAVRLVLDGR